MHSKLFVTVLVLANIFAIGAFFAWAYDSLLKRRFAWLGVTLMGATMLTLLLVPFFMMAQSELAPKEDQGVVFSILLPSPTSTIDQNVIYAKQVQKMFESVPEYENSFQLTSTSFGFAGIILKPWSERKRSSLEIEQALQAPAAAIPGLNVVITTPDPLPSGGSMPIEFVIRSTADHKEMQQFAEQLALYANTEANAGGGAPTFYFADTDLKFDLPQVEIEIDKDKVASMGLNLSDVARDLGSMLGGGYVNRFVNDGRSYRVIPQVERGQRLNAEPAARLPRARAQRSAHPALDHRHAQGDGAAAHAQPLPAAQLRQDHRRRPEHRRRAEEARGQGRRDPARRLHHRLRRPVPPAAQRGQRPLVRRRARAGADLPGARGAVQQLPRSLHHPARLRAAGARRRHGARSSSGRPR
jgi:multidrug efflux pump subunit AcrB